MKKIDDIDKAVSIKIVLEQLSLLKKSLDEQVHDGSNGVCNLGVLRNVTVYAQSEALNLAEEPIDDECGADSDPPDKQGDQYTPNKDRQANQLKNHAQSDQAGEQSPISGQNEHWDNRIQGNKIELDRLYTKLDAGRWLIVSGERADILDQNNDIVRGIYASELVMLAAVSQNVQTTNHEEYEKPEAANPTVTKTVHQAAGTNGSKQRERDQNPQSQPLPGDKLHTFITLATPLQYKYCRNSVTIYGNVAHATHGETRQEVLGGGDSSIPFQSFVLHQKPLTYVSAPTTDGAASSLKVYANGLQWHASGSLTQLGPTERGYVVRTDNEGTSVITFGDGLTGARLPTGTGNIQATYRNGIGKPGNVQAKQINLLVTRPLGVQGVVNPLPSTGGADPETRDQARRNIPTFTRAFDRIVSLQDYADFARRFAGIGKASARRISSGQRNLVLLTIAGDENIPIDPTSDLFANLCTAIDTYGVPYQPFQVGICDNRLLIIQAQVRIAADYRWEDLAPKIRAALLDTFSFDRRDLGQDVYLSEVIGVMQAIAGVDYVAVGKLDAIDKQAILDAIEKNQSLADYLTLQTRILAHPSQPQNADQLIFLDPAIPDTLILTEIQDG